MDLHFKCTQCGKCCRDIKLPLTVSEAMDWLRCGHPVQVICEALPWLEEPPADDLKAAHRRRRSFATMAGLPHLSRRDQPVSSTRSGEQSVSAGSVDGRSPVDTT